MDIDNLIDKAIEAGNSGDWEKAKTLYEEAFANNPDNPNITNGLGIVSMALHNADKAIEWYNKTLAIVRRVQADHGEAELMAHNGLGIAYTDQGNLFRAELHYKVAYALNAANPQAVMGWGIVSSTLGKLSMESGDLVKAKEHYHDLLALQPNNITALKALGTIAEKGDQPYIALAFFERAASLSPDDMELKSRVEKLSNIHPGKPLG